MSLSTKQKQTQRLVAANAGNGETDWKFWG